MRDTNSFTVHHTERGRERGILGRWRVFGYRKYGPYYDIEFETFFSDE